MAVLSTKDQTGMDLRDYLVTLRRRRGIIFLTVFVIVAIAVGLSLLQTPVYEGHARVLLQPSRTVFETDSGQGAATAVRIDTEVQLIGSAPVQELVRERLGVAPKASVSQVGQTEVINISAESTDPEIAARIANTYAESYIDFRREQAINSLNAAADQIRRKIEDLQKPIDELTAALAAAPRPPGQTGPVSSPERDALIGQKALFKQRLDQLQVDLALKDGGAQLVAPAVVPTSPVRPTPVRNGVLALGVGLFLALAIAFAVDHLDDSIKTGSDLERAGSGISLLGLIPAVPWRNKEEAQLISLKEPASPAAEAYRTLRTSITFLGLDRKLSVLQITSPSSSEGKSTTLANLAVAMARAGQRVILIDCDLRRPRIHEFFELPNDVGFTSVLVGSAPLSIALQKVDPRIQVLTAGPQPTNPSELLSSNRAGAVLAAARAQADFVLVDCPPVLPVTDAAVLSAKVDGTILVANAGVTSIKDVAHALQLLQRVEAPVIGAVLNSTSSGAGYGYGYGYGYGATTASSGNGSGKGRGRKRNRRSRTEPDETEPEAATSRAG